MTATAGRSRLRLRVHLSTRIGPRRALSVARLAAWCFGNSAGLTWEEYSYCEERVAPVTGTRYLWYRWQADHLREEPGVPPDTSAVLSRFIRVLPTDENWAQSQS